MQVISETYRDLNSVLHNQNAEYGTSGHKHAETIAEIKEATKCDTVLDYGCGKSTLMKALQIEMGSNWFKEYDPAIPGKDMLPGPADMVVCTDVMEHIEPDHLDSVLEHIKNLANKTVYFVISTKLAKKTLPDGRNTHLIVQNADWWMEKLQSAGFYVNRRDVKDDEVSFLCLKNHIMEKMRLKGVLSFDERKDHVLQSYKLGLPVIKLHEPHDGIAAIACYGPSLKNNLWRLKIAKEQGVKIICNSGAHDLLIANGIVPDYWAALDPRENSIGFVKTPHPDVTYLLASKCHPGLFEQLKNNKVIIWHAYDGEEMIPVYDSVLAQFYITAGSNIGVTCFSLMGAMGFKTFDLYGMDCSFESEEVQHAGPHNGKPMRTIEVTLEGKKYITSAQMVSGAYEFINIVQAGQLDVTMFCGGLLQDMTSYIMKNKNNGVIQYGTTD